jgi:hypothetical protein
MRRELSTYPGLAELLMTRANHGPGALRAVETILGIFADAGLDERAAARYYLLFIDLVLGRIHRELHGDPVDRHRTAGLLAIVRELGDFPHLSAAEPYLRDITGDQIFHAEIDMLIDAVHRTAGTPSDRIQ